MVCAACSACCNRLLWDSALASIRFSLCGSVPLRSLSSVFAGHPRELSRIERLVSFPFISGAGRADICDLPLVLTFVLLHLWQEVQGLAFFSSMFSEQAAQLFEAIPMLEAGISLPTLLKWALAIPDLFLIWMLTALSAYFVCRDKRTLAKFLVKQLPKTEAFRVRQVYQHTSGALWHYLQMQLLLMVISTGVSMIFFGILELPFPLLSGFLVGFFDLCPILGPGLVYLSLALLQLWWGNTAKALALGLGYLILLLLRQWGEPHLVSERIGLHPLVALLGLYAAFAS